MTPATVQGKPWDSFDAYLFDIDGTLLHCTDAVHYFAFCDSLSAIAGKPLTLDGINPHGNTDVGILRDAFALADVSEHTWRTQLPEIRERMCRHVEAHKHEFNIEALPSVPTLLQHLQAKGAVLGIATGNLRGIGTLKLQHVGLMDFFTIGGWSDDHETRADVFRAALALMRQATTPDANICVLGDTPADIQAAQANNVPVIAVATGIYTREDLLIHNPDLCLESFTELFA